MTFQLKAKDEASAKKIWWFLFGLFVSNDAVSFEQQKLMFTVTAIDIEQARIIRTTLSDAELLSSWPCF